MTMDFLGSSKRHYQDAELLTSNNRYPNAGHLFGFAAECGLKALLISHGLRTNPATGDIVESHPYKYKTHVDVLINNVFTFSSSRNFVKYLSIMPGIMAFSNWKIEHRYFFESLIPASLSNWKKAAGEVMKALQQAELDGVIQ